MYDERGILTSADIIYKDYSDVTITLGAIEPGGIGQLIKIRKIASGINIRKI